MIRMEEKMMLMRQMHYQRNRGGTNPAKTFPVKRVMKLQAS